MPFTFSHPAIVLPLGRWLPIAALVLGAMSPDVGLMVPGLYRKTHSWLGLVTWDLVLTIFGLVIWNYFSRDALVDLAPTFIRERISATRRLTRAEWILVPLAALIGSASHVFWDGFTHANRFGSNYFKVLSNSYFGTLGAQWLQLFSTFLGGLFVLFWGYRWWRQQPKANFTERVLPQWLVPVTILGVVLIPVLIGLQQTNPRARLFTIGLSWVSVTGLAILALGIIYSLKTKLATTK